MSSDNLNTQPTIETVLDRINEMSTLFENRLDQIGQDVAEIKKSVTVLERHGRRIDIRLDKIESIALSAKSEIADLHDQLLERIPELK